MKHGHKGSVGYLPEMHEHNLVKLYLRKVFPRGFWEGALEENEAVKWYGDDIPSRDFVYYSLLPTAREVLVRTKRVSSPGVVLSRAMEESNRTAPISVLVGMAVVVDDEHRKRRRPVNRLSDVHRPWLATYLTMTRRHVSDEELSSEEMGYGADTIWSRYPENGFWIDDVVDEEYGLPGKFSPDDERTWDVRWGRVVSLAEQFALRLQRAIKREGYGDLVRCGLFSPDAAREIRERYSLHFFSEFAELVPYERWPTFMQQHAYYATLQESPQGQMELITDE